MPRCTFPFVWPKFETAFRCFRMITVGITGGIGSGKSTVCGLFEQLNIPIYESDSRAKLLYVENSNLKNKVIRLLGEEAYVDQKLNREFVSNKVFENKKLLEGLNAIVHPAVAEDFENWKLVHSTAPYVIKEAAILVETGGYKNCDQLILVTAPKHIRLERVLKRDGSDEKAVLARMDKQWLDEKKRPFANYEIVNDGDHSLIEQVLTIHKQILTITNRG